MNNSESTVSPILLESMRDACNRVAPLWPLQHFVAVNPFVGMAESTFQDTAARMSRIAHGSLFRSPAEWEQLFAKEPPTVAEFRSAVDRVSRGASGNDRGWLEHWDLSGWLHCLRAAGDSRIEGQVLTACDCADRHLGSYWSNFVVDEISKWFASFSDAGQASWHMAGGAARFFPAWQDVSLRDWNPAAAGLGDFREIVRSLPADAPQLIEFVVRSMNVPESSLTDFLHRQLMSVHGWSAHARYRDGGAHTGDPLSGLLLELLAVRLAYDWVVHKKCQASRLYREAWAGQWSGDTDDCDRARGVLAGLIAQEIAEARYRSTLFPKVLSAGATSGFATERRPQLQAIFCIDVRSEPYRRALEGVSPEIDTLGFAGFFGLPIATSRQGGAQAVELCPVLLKPRYQVPDTGVRFSAAKAEMQSVVDRFANSAVSCFPFVETCGLGFGTELLKRLLPRWQCAPATHTACDKGASARLLEGIPSQDQVDLAERGLRGMGLTQAFAPRVLVCGHGSASTNNPYAASLDCGACGGHAGDLNARVFAALLNQAPVRAGLARRGIFIPANTVFLAGLHNTTTDELQLFESDLDAGHAPASLNQVRVWLDTASRVCRAWRAGQAEGRDAAEDAVWREVLRRSADWGEVRPEWGLAGNAAFIAAPRSRTRALDLSGRTFLHDYDMERDPDFQVLESILTAPVVVASWINLQYYASRVHPGVYGSGSKILHNVVGTFGVWEGNAGDLKVGLPLQSLHDGQQWMHEPLRLSVLIEAPRAAIDAILAKHPPVQHLARNGWIRLVSVDPVEGSAWLSTGDGSWVQEWGSALVKCRSERQAGPKAKATGVILTPPVASLAARACASV